MRARAKAKDAAASASDGLRNFFRKPKKPAAADGSHSTAPLVSATAALHNPSREKSTTQKTNENADSSSLWYEAYQRLSPETQNRLGILSDNAGSTDQIEASELGRLIRIREEEFKDGTPKLKIGGREYIWRDYARRAVSLATLIGNVAIQFSPMPSLILWSGLKTLLQAHVTQCEDITAVFGCADKVLSLVRRGKIYEVVYVGSTTYDINPYLIEELRSTLVTAYAEALELLALAGKRLNEGATKQFLEALIRGGDGEKLVSELNKTDDELSRLSQACAANYNHSANEKHWKLLQSLEEPLRRIDESVQDIYQAMEAAELQTALDYISAVQVGSIHLGKSEARTPGTCQWLIDHASFREWEDSSSSSMLWLNVGAGKSFLTSNVIDRYRFHHPPSTTDILTHEEGFAYFYCNRTDANADADYLKCILQSYICQLANAPNHSSSIHKQLHHLYTRARKEKRSFTRAECEAQLMEFANSYPQVTLVLDALDECGKNTRREIMAIFRKLLDKGQNPVKIFVSSRRERDIEAAMETQTVVDIRANDNKQDIEKFLQEELQKLDDEWAALTDEDKRMVTDTLRDKSDGMFRWVFLQWEQLKTCKTRGSVLKRLGNLPKDLTDAYEELYSQNQDDDQIILQRAVKWVVHSPRPLSALELLSAVRLDTLTLEKTAEVDDAIQLSTLENICRHLIVYDSHQEIWKFPHASVPEYFEIQHKAWMSNADEDVAIQMLLCLIHCYSEWSLPEDSDEADQFWSDRPSTLGLMDPRHRLQKYIRKHWISLVQHISREKREAPRLSQVLKRFLGANGPQQPASQQYQQWVRHRAFLASRFEEGVSPHEPLNLLPRDKSILGICVFGFHVLLQDWWEEDIDVFLVNEHHRDLLSTAAWFGHKDLCHELLRLGSDVNRPLKNFCGCALNEAISAREFSVAELLLSRGADPNLCKKTTALYLAMDRGTPIVELLLKYGADPNLQFSETYFRARCALSFAASYSDVEVTELLIKNGADVDLQAEDGYGSPLATAAYYGSTECVKFLVQHGADVNAILQHGSYHSALAAALLGLENSAEITRYLIEEAGADTGVLTSNPPYIHTFRSPDRKEDFRFLVQEGYVPVDVLKGIRQLREVEYM